MSDKRLWEVQCNLRGEACIHVEAKTKAEAKRMARSGTGHEDWGHWDVKVTAVRDVIDCGPAEETDD